VRIKIKYTSEVKYALDSNLEHKEGEMNWSWIRLVTVVVLTGLLLGLVGQTQPLQYPIKPITINVPWSPGGGTDRTARALAASLQEILGVQVGVVNKTGGGGVIGHRATADVEPDGYTLGMITVEITMMHWLGLTDLTYRDYDPIALLINNPAGVIIRTNDVRFQTYEELVQYIQAHPGELTATGTAAGGIWHLGLIQWLRGLGLPADAVRWVPSRGASEGLQFLLAETVDICTCSPLEALPLAEQGRVEILAVMFDRRLSALPDVPTLQELGVNAVVGGWAGLAGPRGLPNHVLAVLHKAVFEAFWSDGFQTFLETSGFNPDFRLGYRFEDFMSQQDQANGEALQAAGLTE